MVKIKINQKKAQATLEFVFAFIVVMLIFYSCVKALQWAGIIFVRPIVSNESVKQNPPADNAEWWEFKDQMTRPSEEIPQLNLIFQESLMQ
ncbi:MAG: hypothetical protein PHY73_00650 [Candidatus Omnitrophica bacterium]|nr:hypothetical protein [Candidatus Omnitrophota bacterium]